MLDRPDTAPYVPTTLHQKQHTRTSHGILNGPAGLKHVRQSLHAGLRGDGQRVQVQLPNESKASIADVKGCVACHAQALQS